MMGMNNCQLLICQQDKDLIFINKFYLIFFKKNKKQKNLEGRVARAEP